MTDAETNSGYAQLLATRDFRVLPCCWPGAGGRCGCGWNHQEKNVGKAPRVAGGVTQATTRISTVWQWWKDTPQANVAIALEPGYIMLDPDSPEALAEVEDLGVPRTLTRISRNKAFIFKAPPDLPPARMVHRGESRAIDVFSNGYCIVYGTHRTGARIYLEDLDVAPADPPAWLLQWITHAQAAPAPREEPQGTPPPVRLDPKVLGWWDGTRRVGSGGSTDRSATLYRIGQELAYANAGELVIARALAERDRALGYDKYSGRKDAALRYGEIARQALASGTGKGLRDQAPAWEQGEPDGDHPLDEWRLRGHDLYQVAPKPVYWLWPKRLPLGKFSLLAGDPGLGKSYLTLDLAARVSLGGPWPDGAGNSPLGKVLIISVEDAPADTIRPRVDLLGGDLHRIRTVDALVESDGGRASLSLQEHLYLLEQEITAHHITLLVLDPILAFTGLKADTHRASDVRAVLAPLAGMADRTMCAVLGVIHLNKRSGEFNSIYRITASLDIAAAARSVQIVGKHPDEEQTRVLAPVKMNLSAMPASLEFGFTTEGIFQWRGESGLDADSILQHTSREEKSALETARDFIEDTLASGPRLSKQVLEAAREHDINEKTLRRAAKDVGVYIQQLKNTDGRHAGTGWFWTLLPEDERDSDGQDPRDNI